MGAYSTSGVAPPPPPPWGVPPREEEPGQDRSRLLRCSAQNRMFPDPGFRRERESETGGKRGESQARFEGVCWTLAVWASLLCRNRAKVQGTAQATP